MNIKESYEDGKKLNIQGSYLKSSPHILKLACYGITSRMISPNSKQKGHKYSLFKEPSIFATLYLAHQYTMNLCQFNARF